MLSFLTSGSTSLKISTVTMKIVDIFSDVDPLVRNESILASAPDPEPDDQSTLGGEKITLQCLSICLLVYFATGDAGKAQFIKPCKPDDRACIKESTIAAAPYIMAGVKELGLPPVDPIVLNDVRADDKDLKLGFRNMEVTGVNKCKVLDLVRDLDKATFTLTVECPIRATGQYSLLGKLLFIAAEGDGEFLISTDKAKIEVTLKTKTVESDGAKHWKITGFDYSYEILDKAKIDLKNLFGGDETRAKPIREVLDHSAKELIESIGGPIIKELINKEVEIIKKFFKAVPVSELELS